VAVGAAGAHRRAGGEALRAVRATETGRARGARLAAVRDERGADALQTGDTRCAVELDLRSVVRRRLSLCAAARRVRRLALRLEVLILSLDRRPEPEELPLSAAVGLMDASEAVRGGGAGSIQREDRLTRRRSACAGCSPVSPGSWPAAPGDSARAAAVVRTGHRSTGIRDGQDEPNQEHSPLPTHDSSGSNARANRRSPAIRRRSMLAQAGPDRSIS
jgi:hypothetical protein